MAGQVWFGTEDNMQWVPAPLTDANLQRVSWQDTQVNLNGGAYSVKSAVGHTRFGLSWAAANVAELDKIVRLLSRPGLLHYVDPVTAQHNAMPSYWAEFTDGAPPLFPGVPSTVVDTGAPVNGYNREAIKYSVTQTKEAPFKLFVPPGYNIYFGVHGTQAGTAQLYVGNNPITIQATSSSARTNITLPGDYNYSLSLRGSGELTINGITAVIAKQSPVVGQFVSGYGHSGLRLDGQVQMTEYSAVIPNAQVALSAEFVEVGAWQ